MVTQVDIEKLASHGGDREYQGYHDYYGYSNLASKRKLHLSREELSYINTNTMPDLNFDGR